jgi:hypothetical protein
MKKLFTIISLLLISTSYSQIIVLLDEDFDGNTAPTGWLQSNDGGGTGTQEWTFGSPTMPGSSAYHVANFPNNAAIFDDDTAGANGQHDKRELRSTYIDASMYTNATMKLRYQYALNNKGIGNDNYFDDHLRVYIFDDAGDTSSPLSDHNQSTDPVYHWIDLAQALRDNPDVNPAHFRIFWEFDDGDSSFGWGCGIDDVAVMVHPDNDDCQHAIVIDHLTYATSQNAVGATNNNGFITPSGCGVGMNDGVWYTFTPTQSGTVTIAVSPTGWDAEVAVYSGSCGNFICEANADDPETITDLAVTAGTQYFINIGYYSAYTNEPEGLYAFVMTGTALLGTDEDRIIQGLEIYPNPAENTLHIQADRNINEINVYNILGQEILNNKSNSNRIDLNIENLLQGSYILKVVSGNQVESHHFIKK